MRSLRAEESGYVRGLILQAALAMTILGLTINDGGQIVAAQVRAESVARAAATAGADTWYRIHKADRGSEHARRGPGRIPQAVRHPNRHRQRGRARP